MLRVLGTVDPEGITVSRTATGALRVNNGAIAITGGVPTTSNTSLIEVLGDAGNDIIALVETMGALPAADLRGGAGDDTLTGGSSDDALSGEANNDTLYGRGGSDWLDGGAGNDVLDGGTGADVMTGLGGDDIYYVDDAADAVVEGAGGGTLDRILASASYTLGAGVEVERLTTVDVAATTAINLTGNASANVIYGNAGSNFLDGMGGADLMAGQGGDDRYYVDHASDVVVEGAGGGTTDQIFASVSYALAAGVHVEILATSGYFSNAAIDLTGNELANSLSGNTGNNVLDGGGGADSLSGGEGNDWYYVDSAGDTVSDPGNQGADDRVYASVSYTLGGGAEIETLATTNYAGTTAINLTGNGFANDIHGNAGVNLLDGKGGADLLVGLGGADTFAFTTALGAGNVDTISGFSVADDTIRLENAVFAGLAAGALAAGAFNTGSAATQANDRIIYNSATGALLFDADGLGGSAGVQFAVLAGGLALTSADFIVV